MLYAGCHLSNSAGNLAMVETAVSIGESNDNFVQITDGLEEGDVVYLYRPYDKKQSE